MAWLASDVSSSGKAWPCIGMPSSPPSWLVAMMMADAVMKPVITGCERKFATKPRRKSPISVSMPPESRASRMAALA